MDVAVTGSTGLIGEALVASLGADGHRVLRVVRRNPGTDEIGWDPAAGKIDVAGFDGIDAVVHLAGETIASLRWSAEKRAKIRDSRVEGTTLVAEAIAKAHNPPKVFVSGSAIGFYGSACGDTVLAEDAPAGTDWLATGVTVPWEACAQPAADAGVRTAMIRTGLVLSPKGGLLGRLLPIFRLGAGGPLGNGRQWMSWIALDDEIGAIRHIIDNDHIAGPVNLTAPNPVTNAEFTKALGRAVHRPAFMPVPAFAMRLMSGAELADSLFFASQRVVPDVLTGTGYAFAQPEIDTALASML